MRKVALSLIAILISSQAFAIEHMVASDATTSVNATAHTVLMSHWLMLFAALAIIGFAIFYRSKMPEAKRRNFNAKIIIASLLVLAILVLKW